MIKLTGKINFKLIAFVILALIFSYIAQINLAITLFLAALYAYLRLRKLNLKNCNLLNLTLLFLAICAAAYFLIRRNFPIYYIPFSAVPMLTTLLFGNLEVSLLMALESFDYA